MKGSCVKAEWQKECKSKHGGMLHLHSLVIIDDEMNEVKGFYISKSKDQKKFIEGQDCEYITEKSVGTDGVERVKIKPSKAFEGSSYGRAVKKEQTRYSGFAVSYVKDLVVAGILQVEGSVQSPAAHNDSMMSLIKKESEYLFNVMVDLDKTLE